MVKLRNNSVPAKPGNSHNHATDNDQNRRSTMLRLFHIVHQHEHKSRESNGQDATPTKTDKHRQGHETGSKPKKQIQVAPWQRKKTNNFLSECLIRMHPWLVKKKKAKRERAHHLHKTGKLVRIDPGAKR